MSTTCRYAKCTDKEAHGRQASANQYLSKNDRRYAQFQSRGIGSQETEKGVYRYSQVALAKQTTDADLHNAEAMLQTYDKTLGGQSGSGGNANEDHHRLQADDFKNSPPKDLRFRLI